MAGVRARVLTAKRDDSGAVPAKKKGSDFPRIDIEMNIKPYNSLFRLRLSRMYEACGCHCVVGSEGTHNIKLMKFPEEKYGT